MQRGTQGNYRFLCNWWEFTPKWDWNSPDFMVGCFGANLFGIIALRSNSPLALPWGPVCAQEWLETERFPPKIAPRVIAIHLSGTDCVPAPDGSHTALVSSRGGSHGALDAALGLETQKPAGLLPAARALPSRQHCPLGRLWSLALFSFGFWEVFWGISNIRLIACICWTRFSQEHPSSQGMFLGLLSNAPFPADVKFSPKLSPSARGGDGGKCLSLGSERSDTVLEAGGSPGAPDCHQTGAPHHLFLQHRALLGRGAALGRFQGPLTILTLHQL